jgi:hypothetical protein
MEGYQWTHGKKLITLFSCPNYSYRYEIPPTLPLLRHSGDASSCHSSRALTVGSLLSTVHPQGSHTSHEKSTLLTFIVLGVVTQLQLWKSFQHQLKILMNLNLLFLMQHPDHKMLHQQEDRHLRISCNSQK